MQPIPEVPGYELLKRLGGGPLTWVYSARDCVTEMPCAVKVIREDWEDRSTAIKLLQREARAGLSVHHRHLVRVLEAHVTRPPHYLVMELLPGESLRRRLKREQRIDLGSSLWIVRQTAEALVALHHAGFVHGDVKPDNIRLVDDGTATLIDLGFAHRPGENVHFFDKGYILGTVNYLSPELCQPQPTEDTSTDVFSLGVTLFEILAGKLPYPTGTLEAVFFQRCHLGPECIGGAAEDLPPALVNLVGRMLSREPADRPKASAVVQQLMALEMESGWKRRSA
jgi:serine/threonine protein kinase